MFETKKTNYLPIVIGVVVVIVALVAFFLWRSSSENSNNNSTTPTPTPTSETTPSPTDTEVPTVTLTSTPTETVTPTASVTPTGPQEVKVYYSQDENPTDPTASNSLDQPTYAVYRVFTTSRPDVETYVMEKMIEGPSASDQSTYYWFTPIKLTGDSNCGGKNFTLEKNSDGTKVTIKFCKQVETAGVGDDARIKSVIGYGIKQFAADPADVNVVILTKDDHCFGDLSGQDLCKS